VYSRLSKFAFSLTACYDSSSIHVARHSALILLEHGSVISHPFSLPGSLAAHGFSKNSSQGLLQSLAAGLTGPKLDAWRLLSINYATCFASKLEQE